jgi:hypothetical protein
MMKQTSIIVDFQQLQCESCKAIVNNEMATVCPACGAVFDCIISNYAGFAAKLKRRREAAGVHQCQATMHTLVPRTLDDNDG